MQYHQIKTILEQLSQNTTHNPERFFKTRPGDYAEDELFIGVKNPDLRKLVLELRDLTYQELDLLLESRINEERLLALFILVDRYEKGTTSVKEDVYQFYMTSLRRVNNWNLVDTSAHLILGAYSKGKNNTDVILKLARSTTMWERRIAMVSTWHFIQHQDYDLTFKVAKLLLKDTHVLIHKAVGWMLREVGKRDVDRLLSFLDRHVQAMPRTTLRYAIERLSAKQKEYYMSA